MFKTRLVLMALLLAAVVVVPVQAVTYPVVLDPMTLDFIVDTPLRDGAPGRWWDLRGMLLNPPLGDSAFSCDSDGSLMVDYSYNITETLDDDPAPPQTGNWWDREISGLFQGAPYLPRMPDLSIDEFHPGTPNPDLAFSFCVWTAGAGYAEHLRELQVYDSQGKRALYTVTAWNGAPVPGPGWRHVVAPLTSLGADGGMDWSRVNELKFWTSAWIQESGVGKVPESGAPVYIDDLQLIQLVTVNVDIKPESSTNPMSLKGEGVISVAILGSADLDVSDIDAASVKLAGAPALRSKDQDVNSDGYTDLVLKFNRSDIVAGLAGTQHGDVVTLTLFGATTSGGIVGSDTVVIVGKADPAQRPPKK